MIFNSFIFQQFIYSFLFLSVFLAVFFKFCPFFNPYYCGQIHVFCPSFQMAVASLKITRVPLPNECLF